MEGKVTNATKVALAGLVLLVAAALWLMYGCSDTTEPTAGPVIVPQANSIGELATDCTDCEGDERPCDCVSTSATLPCHHLLYLYARFGDTMHVWFALTSDDAIGLPIDNPYRYRLCRFVMHHDPDVLWWGLNQTWWRSEWSKHLPFIVYKECQFSDVYDDTATGSGPGAIIKDVTFCGWASSNWLHYPYYLDNHYFWIGHVTVPIADIPMHSDMRYGFAAGPDRWYAGGDCASQACGEAILESGWNPYNGVPWPCADSLDVATLFGPSLGTATPPSWSKLPNTNKHPSTWPQGFASFIPHTHDWQWTAEPPAGFWAEIFSQVPAALGDGDGKLEPTTQDGNDPRGK